MSRPPPPSYFPPPFSNTPNSNVTRTSVYLPPGPAHPPQTSNYGIYLPQLSGTYPTSQPHQPPPARRTRDPYSVNSYAPASTYTYSSSTPHPSAHLLSPAPPQHSTFPIPSSTYTYSSSSPYPSANLPSSGPPQTYSTFPIPSVPGRYSVPTNVSGMPPPSMTQRISTMPTPDQAHSPHSMLYPNVPAPAIFHQPSHSGMSGGASNVTGDRSHCACIVYNVYQNTMFSDRLST